MTHPYNDDSTPIVSNTSPARKDEYGIFFIGLIAFLGLGYLLFNPSYIHSSNNSDSDTKIHISASNLNSEKITYDLLETRTPSMDTQIATDSKN